MSWSVWTSHEPDKKIKLDDCIYEFINTGKPFVGICLGMQLLFDESSEFGNHKGLGLVEGNVNKFKKPLGKGSFQSLKLVGIRLKKVRSHGRRPIKKK